MRAAATIAHQMLVTQVHAVLARFDGMPAMEKAALLGQVIGHLISEVPDARYTSAEVMHAVALNIAEGNRNGERTIRAAIQGAGK